MEIVSCHSTCCQYVLNFNEKGVKKSLSLHQLDLSVFGGRSLISVVNKLDRKHLRRCYLDQFSLRRLDKRPFSKVVNALSRFEHVNPTVSGANYNSYLLDEEENSRNVSGKSNSKVIVPGLPDETKGEYAAPITKSCWEWKPKLNVHYEKSGSENVDSPPLLFLPGFGVGSFHYEKQLKDLGCDFRAWALDFLGQGLSLPSEDPTLSIENAENLESTIEKLFWGFGDETEPWAKDLAYSADLWRDQVLYFIEEVIGEPVYIVGNSLGGFVALYFAACYPHLVKGITLLNATPFWGFVPNPMRSPKLSRIIPWAGAFPIPSMVRKLTEVVWQKISDPESIAEVLSQVYADHSTNIDNVFSRILAITKHPAAAASFASIMFAPQGQLTFKEALYRCQMNGIPICLIYGKEDPWVKPIWGLQIKRQLPEAPYYELTPAGHCPHDEVPEVVNFLLRGWIRNVESQDSVNLPLLDGPESSKYDFAKVLEFTREGLKKLVRVNFYGSRSSFWNRLGSSFRYHFREQKLYLTKEHSLYKS